MGGTKIRKIRDVQLDSSTSSAEAVSDARSALQAGLPEIAI
jgi:hypothetical protein